MVLAELDRRVISRVPFFFSPFLSLGKCSISACLFHQKEDQRNLARFFRFFGTCTMCWSVQSDRLYMYQLISPIEIYLRMRCIGQIPTSQERISMGGILLLNLQSKSWKDHFSSSLGLSFCSGMLGLNHCYTSVYEDSMLAMETFPKPFGMDIVILGCWNIWLQRNGKIFRNVVPFIPSWRHAFKEGLLLLKWKIKDKHAALFQVDNRSFLIMYLIPKTGVG